MTTPNEQPAFGFAFEVSDKPKGATFTAQDYMKHFLDVYMAHGGLFDQAQAARMAGVSKQRINALVKAGKLRFVSLTMETPAGPQLIEQTIAGNDLLAWMEAPKSKGGGHLQKRNQRELQAA